jgi:hypothetical protein
VADGLCSLYAAKEENEQKPGGMEGDTPITTLHQGYFSFEEKALSGNCAVYFLQAMV